MEINNATQEEVDQMYYKGVEPDLKSAMEWMLIFKA